MSNTNKTPSMDPKISPLQNGSRRPNLACTAGRKGLLSGMLAVSFGFLRGQRARARGVLLRGLAGGDWDGEALRLPIQKPLGEGVEERLGLRSYVDKFLAANTAKYVLVGADVGDGLPIGLISPLFGSQHDPLLQVVSKPPLAGLQFAQEAVGFRALRHSCYPFSMRILLAALAVLLLTLPAWAGEMLPDVQKQVGVPSPIPTGFAQCVRIVWSAEANHDRRVSFWDPPDNLREAEQL